MKETARPHTKCSMAHVCSQKFYVKSVSTEVSLPSAAFDFSGARKVLTMSSEYDGESSVGGRIVSGGIAG